MPQSKNASWRTTRTTTVLGVATDIKRHLGNAAGPALDLFVRIWLAIPFLASAAIKVPDWDRALLLSAEEYPVSWMDPVTAAYVGVSIELVFPVLLILGLGVRVAAVPLLALTAVIHFEYSSLPENVFWAILFGWYIVAGAGPISLDRLIARGFSDTALPLAEVFARLYAALTRYGAPAYCLLPRAWMAVIFFLSGLSALQGTEATSASAAFAAQHAIPVLEPLPGSTTAAAFVLILGVLLLLGLATRFATLPLIAVTALLYLNTADPDQIYVLLMLALLLVFGPGSLSLDHLLESTLHRLYPQVDDLADADLAQLPHVVIIGAGFGGLSTAVTLRKCFCRVTVIDRHNYHLFQPLLYQVATASLSPADIATPVRGLFRDQRNARVLLGRVTDVDTEQQEIVIREKRIPYDYLVLATGARHSYFGRDEWQQDAPGLKQIDDATKIRRRLLIAFERAESSDDPQEQQSLLTFIIVGAGPTGVELAGAIVELAHHGMHREFRHIDPSRTRVILVQSGPRVLPAFSEQLSAVSEAALKRLGVEVLTGHRVEEVDDGGVVVAGKRIESRTVFWAAGVVASDAAKWLGVPADRAGRVIVEPDLSVPGHGNVFAIGDTAAISAWKNNLVPGLAPAAKQAGIYVADVIRARLDGHKSPPPFRYHHLGNLATIGRKAAVADFGFIRLNGTVAWWLWGLIHVGFLIGVRNRISVMLDWFWAYLTFRRSTRLITGDRDAG